MFWHYLQTSRQTWREYESLRWR